MKRGHHYKIVGLISIIFITFSIFSASIFAAQFIYLDSGSLNAFIDVEDRTRYDAERAATAWNQTPTPAYINFVPGSYTHSYILDGQYGDEWFGSYTPLIRQYIFWGRATKFKILLNRDMMVDLGNNAKQSVIVHEMGHAFCLDDNPSYGNDSIMNYSRDRDTLIIPTSDDETGVNYAY